MADSAHNSWTLTVTALVVAGGRSIRYGTDKTKVVWRGLTLLERAQALVRPFARTVFTGRSVGAPDADGHADGHADDVPAAGDLADEPPGIGPLGSLHAGLLAIRTPWLLVVPCDMPCLTADDVHRLGDVLAEQPGARAAVAISDAGRLQPLFALYHRDVVDTAARQIAEGRYALNELVARIPHVTVPVSEAALTNVNRPSDLPREAPKP